MSSSQRPRASHPVSSDVVSPADRARASDSPARSRSLGSANGLARWKCVIPATSWEPNSMGSGYTSTLDPTRCRNKRAPSARTGHCHACSCGRDRSLHPAQIHARRLQNRKRPDRRSMSPPTLPSSRTGTPNMASVYEVFAPLPPRCCSTDSTHEVEPHTKSSTARTMVSITMLPQQITPPIGLFNMTSTVSPFSASCI